MIGIEILGRWHIASRLVPLHLRQDPPRVVLGVAQMHQLSLIGGFKNGVTHLLAVGEQPQSPLALGSLHRRIGQTRMATLGANKAVVLGSHQRMTRHQAAHGVNPKQLLIEGHLIDTGQVGQRKPCPTETEGAGAIATGILNQLHQFRPVIDLLKRQMLHRSTRNNQAIQRSFGRGLLPSHVQLVEMAGVPGLVGMAVQTNPDRLDLER